MVEFNTYQIEKEILLYWNKKGIFDKLRKQNSKNPNWSFIDGPITANNPMGVHHGWGRTLKDVFQRYHAMRGSEQRFQNGFDCQGLWLEVETEKDLGFNSKSDIENYGLDKFSKACRNRVEKYSAIQTEQSKMLGQWMDWGNDYYTMDDHNITSIWHFLKVCNDKGWLYKGKRILPWCIRCGTSSSKHEMSDEGYADIVHPSVYIKAKIKKRENEYLLIWTTTEWTLSSNVAAAVNPEVDYVKAKYGGDIYYISEAVAGKLDEDGDYEILERLKGKDLIGWEYENFYPEFEIQKDVKPKVVEWKEVGDKDGTGIVHIAPSCGEEDFELGKQLKLKMLNCALDDFGNYNPGFGSYSGRNVYELKKLIVEDLDARGLLFKIENYKHRYPICWRCKSELVFRMDSSWFISCDEIRPKMKSEAAKVHWYPEYVGKLMQNWLDNMDDWNISRRRFWGLPLMFYECNHCKKNTIVGSLEELKKLAVNKKLVEELPELHRPWIDEIKIKCSCGHEVQRITDVGDCWLDAGIVPYSTLNYFEDKAYWKKWFPAQLEIECRTQVRLWFYAQLFMSVALEGVAPYKNILCYEEVKDEKGESMHKSKGNAIWFDEAVQKMGADVMRWQYCSQNPQFDLCFGYGPAKEIQRQLLVINNLATYVKLNCNGRGNTNSNDPVCKWILSRRENLKKNVTQYLDDLEYHKAIAEIKTFILFDLSKTFVQAIRSDLEDPSIQKVLYDSYFDAITLLAPFLPFLTEKINLDLFDLESIHLISWPKYDEKLINEELEKEFVGVMKIIELGLGQRDKAQVGLKWPLGKADVVCDVNLDEEIVGLISKQLNVKTIDYSQGKEISVKLDFTMTKDLEEEGFAREVMRKVQALRKEAGLNRDDRIRLYLKFEVDLKHWKNMIVERCGAVEINFGAETLDKGASVVGDIKKKKFVIGIEKVNK